MFHKLPSFSVKESIFRFNNKLYKQIDGVAMGSPLGPCLANAFLCFHETDWLNRCPSHFKPLLCRTYVDDSFLLFSSPDHVPLFLNFSNSQHPNIKFTMEFEKRQQALIYVYKF